MKETERNFNADELMNAVAATNADAYCVESENYAEEIIGMWDNAYKKTILTDGDEDYEMWAARLDFTDKMPRQIFVGNLDTHQVAFVLTEDNPYFG